MSDDILISILGRDAFEAMSRDQIRALAEKIDAEILSDPDLKGRLAALVQTALTEVNRA